MRVRGVLGLLRSAVLSTCRSWRMRLWGTIRYAQVGRCFHAKELCVAHSGQCAKLSSPRPDVCKSPSSKVMVVDDVSSTCLSPKQTPRPSARNVHMLARVQPLLQAGVSLCPVKVARKLYQGALHHNPVDVVEECPDVDRCRKCLRSLASSWTSGDVQILDP